MRVTIVHEFDDEAVKRLRKWYVTRTGWTKRNGGRALIKTFVEEAIDNYWGTVDDDDLLEEQRERS